MYERERDYTKIQKQHQENIISKLIKFTSNEISFFNAPFPTFFDLEDTLNQQKSDFTRQFLEYSQCFNPKFFTDRIKQKFSKVYTTFDKSELIKFLQNQVELSKWRCNLIYNRLNKPEAYPLFSNYYPLYIESISKYQEECILAIQSLHSETIDYHFIESIIKYDYYHHFCSFQIDNLLYTFKKFPLIRRKEILSIVKETLVNDLIFDLNPSSIPTIITETDGLINELKRLSSFLEIEFDIDDQDGQHFSYSCEKLFFTILNQKISFESTDDSIPTVENPTYLDLLNANFIKKSKIDEQIEFSFDNLIKPSEDGMEQILRKFNNALIKELTKDKVTAFIKLQFCKNRIILKSIIESIKSIEKVAKEILKEDQKNFFNEHFTIFRKITLAVASSVKSNSTQKYSIDNDSLLEIVLNLYDQFYKYKVKILNALREININSHNIDLSSVTKKFIEFRPDLICGDHKLCIQPFQLSVKILKQISSSLQTLINLQIYTQKEFSSLYGHHFPWFEFAVVDTKYQFTNDTFPFSPFEIFPFVEKVADFLFVSRDVVLEITESFSVRSTRYKPYFEYAIWSQLLNEMGNFIINMTPESYSFNSKLSEKVASTMLSPYLNDLNFILNVIHDFKGRNKLKLVSNFRNMLILGWKLQSCLIKSDLLLKIYQEQLLKLEDINDQKDLNFAYGDFEFSAISDDWTSNELEKIANAQHYFQVILEIAVRFNNYKFDIDNIQKVLEMYQYEVPLPHHKPKPEQINRHKAVQMLPSLLFYEPNLIDLKIYPPFFCYITAVKNYTDTNHLIDFYLPYSIRSEISFICNLERNCLHSYLSYEIFYTSSNPKETFFDNGNKFNHFFVPTIPQSLQLDSNKDFLYAVLKFISIRYQLLKYIQHEGFITRIKNSDLEENYREKLLWTSNFFSRIKYEIGHFIKCNDIDFSYDYFNKEREIYCSKQLLVALSVLDNSVKPKIEVKKRKKSDDEEETYSFESVQSVLIDMIHPISSSSSFMNSSLYAQKYLDQFWYQCNDSLKTEFSHHQSQIEKQISDSIIGIEEDKYLDATYEYSNDSLHLILMRFAQFYLDEVKNPKKVTIDLIFKNLTKEIILKGIEKFDNENKIQATYKTRMIYKSGTIESNFLRAKIRVMVEELGKMFEKVQFQNFKDQFKNEEELFESVFNKQTNALKPDCYSERIAIKSSQQIFIPPIQSIQNQFIDEVNYSKLLFCRMICNSILKLRKIESDESITLKIDDFMNSIKNLSALLSFFFDSSRLRLIKTWKGYLHNMLYNLKNSTNSQNSLNIFICNFVDRFKCSVHLNLANKLKANYIKIAHLRDKQNVIKQEQEHFEKQEAKKIRKEFELLVSDLNEEIRKAKLRFVAAKNRFYDASFNAINKIKNDPDYFDRFIREKQEKKEAKKKLLNKTEKTITFDRKSGIEKQDENPPPLSSLYNLPKEQNLSDSTETEVETSESEIEEGDESKEPKISFTTEIKDLDESKIQNNLPLVGSGDSNSKVNSNSDELIDQNNETEVEAFPSFSMSQNISQSGPKGIIVNSSINQNTIMLTSTDKTAFLTNLSSESGEQSDEGIQQQDNKEEEDQQINMRQQENKEEEVQQVNIQQQENINEEQPENNHEFEMKPISAPPVDQNANKSRFINLRKSSSNSPNFDNEISTPAEDSILSGRRNINLRKIRSLKMQPFQIGDNATPSTIHTEMADLSSSSLLSQETSLHPSHLKMRKRQKSATFEMIAEVADRIEITKKSIEELQELCKKLRISTTVSGIAVKRIYTRMINKVAEERKSYSATLWHGRRVLEEDLKEQNGELKEAYKMLNSAESEIELLQDEIAKTKEANVKLRHWKEFNIRQVESIHKELKKVNVNSDVNVSNLLRKIQRKQEELEILLMQQQNFEEEIYYQVREPMMQTDYLKRTLKIRRGQNADENFFRQQKKQSQSFEQDEQTEISKSQIDDEIGQEEENQSDEKSDKLVIVRQFENGSFINSLKGPPPVDISNLPLSEQINAKAIFIREQNDNLKLDNFNLRVKIKEMEEQIAALPKSKKKMLKDNFQPEPKSARRKSHKPIFKPGTRHSKNGLKTGSSRNYL